MANIVQFEDVALRYGTGPETLSDVNFTLTTGVQRLHAAAERGGG